ncbi:hypothetical protein LTR97_006820 [Elasticomyces elasticus]|uniref:Uncharacterized protein n=1 Tax=Elasticomyces elasticus TaxID=574655 RepID=A0AAN7WF51_9PEZI|nr:hypothetical protein LTR97_006820 [Elasticomyces elasticus]
MKRIEVYASVFPNLSHVTSARMRSPTLPPEASERAAKVSHTSQSAAVEDVEAVLRCDQNAQNEQA